MESDSIYFLYWLVVQCSLNESHLLSIFIVHCVPCWIICLAVDESQFNLVKHIEFFWIALFFYCFFCLKGRVTKRDRPSAVPFFLWPRWTLGNVQIIHQNGHKSRARPGLSREPGTLRMGAGAWTPGSFSDVFPSTLAGSWVRSGIAWTWTGALMAYQHCMRQLNLPPTTSASAYLVRSTWLFQFSLVTGVIYYVPLCRAFSLIMTSHFRGNECLIVFP